MFDFILYVACVLFGIGLGFLIFRNNAVKIDDFLNRSESELKEFKDKVQSKIDELKKRND
ncbi:hypothetical protein [Campylobacter cuniculorum]|uniref:Uncharacterized protein n=2 Tax=Campylobacter cuniculorum TaxID=374106 RepID=A0A1W6BV07_9BACT|nr:hypothetical protein [Campylobacter cuniculorum]ARJ55929.1 hypothetical protein CCUN_0274 [Campylobacter cuniculorum DSM 23162 = LMG 24588]QOR05148.1 hypothetical protein A0071_04245 [Campylobacter cuniculorum]